MPSVAPTKTNLMAAKRSLSLAQLGYELMDRKRNVLIHEMMGLIDQASALQSEIGTVFQQAYASLQQANIMTGSCKDISLATPVDASLKVGYRSVMGVELPIVSGGELRPQLSYGLMNTSSALDRAVLAFYRVKELTIRLAELENSIYRLAAAIKKTQKRANALQNIIIPKYTGMIAFISGVLEEREREEYSRLKVIKARKKDG